MEDIRRNNLKGTDDGRPRSWRKPAEPEKPRNTIEEALQRNRIEVSKKTDSFLPPIAPKVPYEEPLKIISEIIPEPIKIEAEEEVQEIKEAKNIAQRTFKYILLLLILMGLVYGSYILFKKYTTPTTVTNDSTAILLEVGKSIALPINEDPTIMTVTNLAPLKGQVFFDDALVGDKVIVYLKSKKAILYRPSEKRVVHVAPLID